MGAATKEPYRGERLAAYRPEQFAVRFNIGRTKVFAEIAAKRLTARKFGRATLILDEDGEAWARSLPVVSQ